MSPRKLTNVRLDEEQIAALQAIKDRDGTPISVQVRKAIQAWIEKKGATTKADRPRARTRERS